MSELADLSELHEELRTVARGLLGTASTGSIGSIGSAGLADPVAWRRFAEVGWLGLEAPERLQGSGATFAETAVVLEELGRAATTTSYLGSVVLGVGALNAVVPSAERDELLGTVAVGERRVAVALASSGDLALVEPAFRLVGAGGDLRLSGRAEFVADAGEADEVLVLAETGAGGLVLVAVPATDLAVTVQPVVDATRGFATVAAEEVAVSPTAVWSFAGPAESAPQAAQRILDRGALAVACDSLGLGAAMLEATVAYVSARHQFGRPVGSFQAVKHQCADMLVQLTVGRELLDAAIEAIVDLRADPTIEVSRAASFLGDAAVDVAGTAMQLHGGIGYSWESGIHVYLKRATLNRSLFGSPAAHRRRLAGVLRG